MKALPLTILDSDFARFWGKVKIANPDECWIWNAGKTGSGTKYGCFSFRKGVYKANRIAYYFKYRVDPFPLDVLHKCDNTLCVNPNHLFLGTQVDNMKDMKAKGRAASGLTSARYTKPERTSRGEVHHWAKLTDSQVREIKLALATTSNKVLATMFNVSPCTIQDIRVGRHWKHI